MNLETVCFMGNYVSCALATSNGGKCRAAKVIFPGGEVRALDRPSKAAELMLEEPSFFLANSQSLQMGRRFSALTADEDLEMGNVYVMFPMKRLNSFVTAADMGALFITANSSLKRASPGKMLLLAEPGGRGAQIVPAPAAETTRLNLEEIEEFSTPEFKHRLSMCRSKKPVLETIVEEPLSSR